MSFLSLLPTALLAALVLAALFCESCGVTRHTAAFGFHAGWISIPSELDRRLRTLGDMTATEQVNGHSIAAAASPPLAAGMPPPPIPLRTSQASAEPRVNPKRLSWNLPIQSAVSSPRRQSIISVSPVPSRPLTPDLTHPVADDPSQLLTAVATQERRVMELKEELAKAEADLAKLKNQWALHEAKNKRIEPVTHAGPLRSMTTPIHEASAQADSPVERSTMLARRKTIHVKAKQPRRFEGGTHTRALSLLSPSSMTQAASGRTGLEAALNRSLPVKESQGVPALAAAVPSPAAVSAPAESGNEQSAANRNSIVGDLREGLWTFFEDLKQATVGDEAATGARARQAFGPSTPFSLSQKTSPSILRRPVPPSRTASGGSPTTAANKASTLEQSPKSAWGQDNPYYDEDWDNWDSPPAKTASTGTARSTPRTSMSSEGSKAKRLSAGFDQLPWQALSKISPSRLSKTASSLMQEWENSIKEPAPSVQ